MLGVYTLLEGLVLERLEQSLMVLAEKSLMIEIELHFRLTSPSYFSLVLSFCHIFPDTG
jgi:hypothetical protein